MEPSAPAPDRDLLRQAFASVQGSLEAMQALQRQTAEVHQRFLEGQEAAQRTFQQLLTGQQRLVEAVLGVEPGTVPAPLPAPLPAPSRNGGNHHHVHVEKPARTNGHHTPTPVMAAPAPLPPPPPPAKPAPAPAAPAAEGVFLQIVADKTGYPLEMLNADMDMESDLGIDSIKRVEILAALTAQLNIPKAPTDRLSGARTLQQVLQILFSTGTPSTNGHATPAPAPPPPPRAPRLERQVLRAVIAPHTGHAGGPPQGPLFVVDDDGMLGAEVARLLGKEARSMRLDALEKETVPVHAGGLILIAGTPDRSWITRAFAQVQRLAPALQSGLVATIARMDGHFGLHGTAHDPMCGALAGIPKTAAAEWANARCLALDVAADAAPALAARALLADLLAPTDREVGIDATGTRRILQITPEPAVSSGPSALRDGDTVVISGGARGVAAEVALGLARETKLRFIIIGRSPVPEPEPAFCAGVESEADLKRVLRSELALKTPAEVEAAWRKVTANREIERTLSGLRAAGSEVRYACADVRDESAVRRALSNVGTVHGIVHAAGILADKRIEDKTAEQFASVFDTKVAGLQNLLAVAAGPELRCLVLFSSMTARFGRPGQIDYCMGNEVLNKTAWLEARRRPQARVVSCNWGPWNGGMVNDGLRREFARLGVGLVEIPAGVQAVCDELRTRTGDVEVLLGSVFPTAAPPTPVLTRTVSVQSHPFLESHRVAGRPILPMAMMLEWMGHAALHGQLGMRLLALEDLQVFSAVALAGEQDVTLSFAVAPAGPQRIKVEMSSGAGLHARAIAHVGSQTLPPPSTLPATPALEPCAPSDPYEECLFHGPHFRSIRKILGSSRQGLGAEVIGAPLPTAFMADPPRTEWLADPVLVDAALQLGLVWADQYLGLPSLPMRIGSYRQHVDRLPSSGVTAHLMVTRESEPQVIGTVALTDGSGRLVAVLEDVEWIADRSVPHPHQPALVSA